VKRARAGGAGEARLIGGAKLEARLIGGGKHEVRLIGGGKHEVRLIGGLWKRSKLPVPDAPGLRPTPDRVRETLFNWLGQDLSGWRVLDAFAGSGALGFEAASRGAAEVVLVEREKVVAAGLERSRERLDGRTMRIVRADGVAWMRRAARAHFDLVLLDPPFDAGLGDAVLDAAAPLVPAGGWIYLESAGGVSPATLARLGLALARDGRAGAVRFQLLRHAAPDGYTPAASDPALPGSTP
jgi:16S rRNA (guanine(966)-N(2))-methyltransferase RsmD